MHAGADTSEGLVDRIRRLRVITWATQWFHRRDALGMLFAAAAFWASVTPSLLPRTWVMQGLVSGVAFASGYAIGALVTMVARAVRIWPRRIDAWRGAIGWMVAVLVPAELVASLRYRDHDWQVLGYTTTEQFLYSGVLVVGAVVVVVLAVLAWLVRILFRIVERQTNRFVPRIAALAVALLACVAVVTLTTSRVLVHRVVQNSNDAMQWRDTNVADDEPDPPTSKFVSAGPESDVAWDEAGYMGRLFLSRTPTRVEIEALSDRPVIDPIRVYVGRATAPGDIDARAELAMAELERTGAFERSALLLATPTGTGWINEQYVQPLEYFLGGDVATVGLQYSHLPSGFAILDDQIAAIDTSRALFDAVSERIARIDEADRPQLYVAGESLGSYGGGGVFEDLDDMVDRADGGVWIGPPAFNALRREAERRRDHGSLQIHPRIAALPQVAFGQDAGAFDGPDVRFAFLQNADDPFMWWDNPLAVERPDWLREPLDPRVNPELRWFPVVSWFQLATDMAVGNSFEEGQGHLYGTLPLDAWHGIVAPDGWDAARVEALRDVLDAVDR